MKREDYSTFKTRDALYNFSRPKCYSDTGVEISCSDFVYTKYSFTLSPYVGVQVVDLYITIPMEMSRVGGYAFGAYMLLYCLLHFYNRFYADKVAV